MDSSKRNAMLIFSDAVLYTIAMIYLSVNATITYFLDSLGAGTFEVGLASALVSVGAFMSQPFFAKKAMNLPHKKQTFVSYLLLQRTLFLLFVLCIPFFAVSHPQLTVILFLAGWAIFNYFVGSYGPFYMSLFAKMIAVERRGKLRGYSIGAGNLLALGASYTAGMLLSKVPFPYNYTLIFAVGVFILFLDALAFAAMKEEPESITPVDIKFFQYFRSVPGILRENRDFKRIVTGFSFILVSQVSLAYYTLYAVREYHIGASEVVWFTAITGLVNIVGSILFGILADRYSHRLILVISSLSAAAGGFAVIGADHLYAVYAAYALTTLCVSGYTLSGGILIVEHVKREELPMYMSVCSLITLIVSSVVTVGSSFLIDSFTFHSVFLLAGTAGLVGAVLLYAAGNSRISVKR